MVDPARSGADVVELDPVHEQGRRIRLGIFFSHPTQHHSVLFQRLAESTVLDVSIYYYDPGSLGSMYDPGYQTAQEWDIDLLGNARSVVLGNLLRGRHPTPLRQLNLGVIPAMRSGRFDAVMLFGYVSLSNRLVMRMAKAAGAAVLYQSDVNVLDESRQKRSTVLRAYRDSFLKRADVILAIGDKNREAYRRFGVEDERMIWCPYPIDTARFSAAREDPALSDKLAELRKRYSIPDDARVVVFCGKLIARKRPGDLIAALRCLTKDGVYGLLVGSGELEGGLRSSLHANENVRITGFVNQSQIPYHMLLADVAVVPSEQDAHPLVVTEFAASGIPVIASHYCGVWGHHDILRPGENGYVYTCGDIPELARRISDVLDDGSVRARMAARSLEIASEHSAQRAANVIVDYLQRRRTRLG